MIETCIITVPTFGWQGDMDNFNAKEQKSKLDVALHQEHYRVKLMNNYEYAGVLFTQYVLERRKWRRKDVKDDKDNDKRGICFIPSHRLSKIRR